jgi:hypothetical protein
MLKNHGSLKEDKEIGVLNNIFHSEECVWTCNGAWGLEKSGIDKELKESYEKPTVILVIKRKGSVWLWDMIRRG